jgi:2'-hydroxyisoflavone reductase
MSILVFGGTLFLGRHVFKAALTRGHEVTLSAGVTSPDFFLM